MEPPGMEQQVRMTYVRLSIDCLYLSPKLKQNTTQTHVLRIKRVSNLKPHASPPKRRDCSGFLKFVCQTKSSKSKQLPRLSSLGI